MLNHCVEDRVEFEYASRNEDATAHARGSLFGEHAERNSRVTVKIFETINYHHLQKIRKNAMGEDRALVQFTVFLCPRPDAIALFLIF